MPNTTSVAPSGSQDINGILYNVRWAVTSLSFSFPSSGSFYELNAAPNNETGSFAALNATQQNFVRAALAHYAAISNLTFNEITESSSQHAALRFAQSNAPSTAWAYLPSTGSWGGDSWYHQGTYNSPVRGNYAAHTFLHELGHALGLMHGHDTSNPFGALPAAHDSLEYSVMTYRSYAGAPLNGYTYETWGAPQTLMQNDIAAIQYLYGPNYSTNSGNTTYTWSATTGEMFVNGAGQGAPGGNRIFLTVWDGGGNDTYDLSNYSTNLVVDLRPGAWTTVSSAQVSNLGGGHMAAGNIANALLYNNNAVSLIENTIGGSGSDMLTGNTAANALVGNGGDDTLAGLDGNDALAGGAGNDTVDGGAGSDSATFGGLRSQYLFTRLSNGAVQVADLRSGSPDGTDTLVNVEFFQFSDLLFTTFNNPPVVVAPNQTVAHGANVAASSLLSASDADGDAIVAYRFWDSTASPSSGHFVVNGVAQGTNQNIEVSAAQLAQTTFQSGVGSDQLWVQVYDGFEWSTWDEFFLTAPANQRPIATAPNQTVAHGANVAASSLFSASDADGDAIVAYRFWDSTASPSSGHFVVNGVAQGTNQNIEVSAAQLAQTTFQSGVGSDQLWVQVYDGFEWSAWDEFFLAAPANQRPIATAPNQTVAHGANVAASSLLSASDADGDAIVAYRFWDSTASPSSGHFVVNGVAQGTNQNIEVSAAQLAQTTFQSGVGSDQLWVQVYDGFEWSAWDEFFLAAPANQRPIATAPNQTVAHGANVAASSLLSASDADGDAIVAYRFWDSTASPSSGHFVVNGVAQGTNQNIEVSAAQLAQTTFQSGVGSDQLWVQVYDGFEWSAWDEFFLAAPANQRPIATAPNQTVAHGANVAASSLLSASDADGDAIVAYRFWDSTASPSSGHFVVNGVAQGTNQNIEVSAAQLAQTTFQSGVGSDQLWVQVYDGFEWSAWDEFFLTAPANQRPIATAPNQTVAHGANVAASSLLSASDADGDAIVAYRFWDSTASPSSGHFVVNGVAQGTNQNIEVSAAQLAQTTFQSGVGSDQLWVQVYDGFEWSAWDEFFVSALANQQAEEHGVEPSSVWLGNFEQPLWTPVTTNSDTLHVEGDKYLSYWAVGHTELI